MSNTYPTQGLPLGTSDFKALYNNASNFDEAMNSESPAFRDRFELRRQTWTGLQKLVADFLESMGFEGVHLAYVDGTPLTVNRPTQLIDRGSSTYRVKQPATFPIALSGNWATDAPLLSDVGESAILYVLAAAAGANRIGLGETTVGARLGQEVFLTDYLPPGTTDLTQAFNDAQDVAFEEGKSLRIPSGTVGVLGPVNVKVSVYAHGAHITRKPGTTGTWFTVSANNLRFMGAWLDGSAIDAEGFSVRGFNNTEISENEILRVNNYALKYNGAQGLKMERNKIRDGGQGISNDSIGAPSNRNIFIKDNEFSNLAGTAVYLSGEVLSGDPLYFKNHLLNYDAVITGNRFIDLAGHGIIGQCYGLVISANQFRNVGSTPGNQSIVPQGYQVSVTGNTIDGGAGVGIDMGWCNVATVSGNTVRGAGQIGIELQSCFATTCTGNAVEDCGAGESSTASSGIRIGQGFFGPSSTSFGVTVSGNTVRSGGNAGRFGISIGEDVKSLIVCGNHLILSAVEKTIFMGSGSDPLIYGNLQDAGKEKTFTMLSSGLGRSEIQSETGQADYHIIPQGSGVLRLGYLPSSASGSTFTPQVSFPIKDRDGNVYYVPARNSPL